MYEKSFRELFHNQRALRYKLKSHDGFLFLGNTKTFSFFLGLGCNNLISTVILSQKKLCRHVWNTFTPK